ncbi:putative zinc metalloproteinase nas-13-like [Apostichopus japonicus]|uniref:Putative zinc metalloproteinase nas-13-like n=1 Tax=Stichopus japonicus TaxID=307972 RepID=A0A2G8L9B0_STIJA|nr:putative zinc metalloproteinase nas-13-like [Apostichopus japonicus]
MEYIFKENQNIDSGIEHYLIEGDIKVDYNVSQVAQNAVRNRNVRWPGGVVPYFIDRSFDAGARQRILAAINRYHQTTCIRFTPWNGQRDYVHIVPRQGCFSAVGRRGGRQELSVGGACNFHRGTIMHELMHAPQRTTTIVPRQAGVSIGNRNDFSATDILKINRYYGCEDTTETEGDETNPDCEETHPNCSAWAARGECSRNPAWMLPNCPVSCQQCRPSSSNVQTTTSTVRGGRVTESVREIHCT